MSDNSNMAGRIAELLERIANALEKTAVSDHAERTEESKERQETLEKTVKTKTDTDDFSDPLAALNKKINKYVPLDAGLSTVSMVAKGLQSLTNSRQAQAGLVNPADSVMGEISQLSSAGVYLSDGDMEAYGGFVSTNQQAMQHNMKMLRQYTTRGTWNNIMDRWGEWKLDLDDDISNKGPWGTLKSRVRGLFGGGGNSADSSARQSNFMRNELQRNQGLDSFGRY